ncbi:hypothetical protein KW785_03305 [Candidatus Parcubacteria bacterium]|nr:hypothetical protein [Candidatus Parcubacteria bacterium]
MIGTLRGTVQHKDLHTIIVDVAGVGYNPPPRRAPRSFCGRISPSRRQPWTSLAS